MNHDLNDALRENLNANKSSNSQAREALPQKQIAPRNRLQKSSLFLENHKNVLMELASQLKYV